MSLMQEVELILPLSRNSPGVLAHSGFWMVGAFPPEPNFFHDEEERPIPMPIPFILLLSLSTGAESIFFSLPSFQQTLEI